MKFFPSLGITALGAVVLSSIPGVAWGDCHYTLDYEGEERSWVGWSPNAIEYRDTEDNNREKNSALILAAKISWTLPFVSFECGKPTDKRSFLPWLTNGDWMIQGLPSLNLKLTQITEHSSAVLPPSFNPRIARIAFRNRRWIGSANVTGKIPNGVEYAWGGIFTVWSHHSNGQYGGTYLDAMGRETNDLGQAVSANRENGDFATNYSGAKVWLRRSDLDENGDMPDVGWTASLEYQYHHGHFPGHLDDKLKPIWGQHHVLADFEYRTGYPQTPGSYVTPTDDLGGAYYVTSGRIWLPMGIQDRPVVESDRAGVTVDIAWFIPKFLGKMGALLQFTYGRDSLNIRFMENRTAVLIGLSLDTSQSIQRWDW